MNVTSAESTNDYLCKAPDDYGTSYYFRGNVTNNYVKFGGYYWRIIRVNGDGSIRMIYAGDASVIDALDESTKQTVLSNGYNDSTTKYTQTGTSVFNYGRRIPGYVGYMYGKMDGTTVEEIYANTKNSTMKTYLEDWYQTNILDEGLSNFIADSGFCNDRTITRGDGIATNADTYYGPYARGYKTLVCPNKERDLFTTSTSVSGNKASLYPVGLITTDEAILAGGSAGVSNTGYYLYTGYAYWTMSPSYFNANYGAAYEFNLYGDGSVNNDWVPVVYGVRPVINLKVGSLNSGTGVWNDPYLVS